jgi:hypothetical protein
MENLNIQEYKLVREEMSRLKDCLTMYVGFVLGASGIAISGIGLLYKYDDNILTPIISLILSLLVNLILLVIFYKFASHNRFAGYCKLLNCEIFVNKTKGLKDQIFAWEFCIEQLRQTDYEHGKIWQTLRSIESIYQDAKLVNNKLEEYIGNEKKPIKQMSLIKAQNGFKFLWLHLFGISKTKSWGFPPLVLEVLLFLNITFLFFGIFGSWQYWDKFVQNWLLLIIAFLLIFANPILWFSFLCKLNSLMSGSSTIDGFFWRFLPIRVKFLLESNIVSRHIGI